MPEDNEWADQDALNENMRVLDKAVTELKDGAPIIFTNVSVDTWVEDTTYEDYPYRADIPCEVTSDYVADVTFDIAEATSGNYAPICITGDGIVSIFASEIPSDTIVIPTIKCVKVVA